MFFKFKIKLLLLLLFALLSVIPMTAAQERMPGEPSQTVEALMVPANCHELAADDLAYAQANGVCLSQGAGFGTPSLDLSANPGTCGTASLDIYDSQLNPGQAWYSISLNSTRGAMTWIGWNINWNNISTLVSGSISGGPSVYFSSTYNTSDLYTPGAGDNIATLTGSVAILGGTVWCTILPTGSDTYVT